MFHFKILNIQKEKAKLKHKYMKESNVLSKFNRIPFPKYFLNISKRGEKNPSKFSNNQNP